MLKIVAFNKPFLVHSQFRTQANQRSLAEFGFAKDLRIAGRLDHDSEGLLLLTNDGQVNQQISHPKFKQDKTYLVQVDGEVTDEAILQLTQGVLLKDGITLPAVVQRVDEPDWLWAREPPIRYRANIPTSWLEISIHEGRNRQVRRMTAAVGFPTLRLVRVRIGTVDLRTLKLQPSQKCPLVLSQYAEFNSLNPDKQQRPPRRTRNSR